MENFILGILFASMVIPIMDGLTSLILGLFEVAKSFMAKTINANQLQPEEAPQRVIGFAAPDNEEEEEEYEDDL